LPSAGVEAIARCRNAGTVLSPTMAMPPCFMKYRRENFARLTPSQHWLFIEDSFGVRLVASARSKIYRR